MMILFEAWALYVLPLSNRMDSYEGAGVSRRMGELDRDFFEAMLKSQRGLSNESVLSNEKYLSLK